MMAEPVDSGPEPTEPEPRARGRRWCNREIGELRAMYFRGAGTDELTATFGRPLAEIEAQLEYLRGFGLLRRGGSRFEAQSKPAEPPAEAAPLAEPVSRRKNYHPPAKPHAAKLAHATECPYLIERQGKVQPCGARGSPYCPRHAPIIASS